MYGSSPRHRAASFLPILNKAFFGAQGREWNEAYMFCIYCKVKNRTQWRKPVIQSDQGIHILHILQSQKLDPMEKKCHTIRSRCACAWNFSGWNSHPLLHDSMFYFGIWAIFLFFLFFVLGHFFLFFCIAHTWWIMKSHARGMEQFCADGRYVFA